MPKRTSGLKRGFSLIETALVIAIGLGMMVAGIMFFAQASFTAQITDTSRIITNSLVNIRAGYRGAENYSGLSLESAVTMGLIPAQEFINGELVHPFGGRILLSDIDGGAGFSLTADGFDQASCMRLFTGGGAEVSVIRSPGTTLSINGTPYPAETAPPGTACAADGNLVEIAIRDH